ncbi:hypothetical protein ASPCADRAFT_134911 [Aspergillus carbonarius ITEM 5010]|uniref:Dioxygenase n=1 Tax=Aspergillus carbonarius (strain ITEM 5010) TaxID=602072 RepID=A0A1R3R8S6_ASPC5|nr:hypothetical protein ASPCADRAFT_134911 [Aspergillus carbonarius ITEM 5010]
MTQKKTSRTPFKDWPNDAGILQQWFDATVEHRESIELPVIGLIPSQLAGTLYHVGPGTYKVPGSNYQLSHWFDGFSHLHRFQIVPQPTGTCKVFYNSRRQVDALIEEARRTGSMKGITFGQKRDPCEKNISQKIKGTFRPGFDTQTPELVNIAVTVHANAPGAPHLRSSDSGKFQTLTSLIDANVLKHMDPDTLEPLGVTRQDGLHPDLKGALSCAHAAIDPESGDLYNYNLDFSRHATYRVFWTSAAEGKTDILATITGPTVKPAVFAEGGIKILWERNLVDSIKFDPSLQTRWYVIDRKNGRGVVANYLSPAFFSFHTINAWQKANDDDTVDIICDIIQYPTDETIRRRNSDANLPKAETLLRIETDFVGDLPTINPKYATRKARYSSFFDAIAKIDLETQEAKIWTHDRHTPGEAIFVPNGTDDAEDAGYLLSVVLNGETGTSYLLCLNARDMTEVGRAECDSAIGFGLHGSHYPSHS